MQNALRMRAKLRCWNVVSLTANSRTLREKTGLAKADQSGRPNECWHFSRHKIANRPTKHVAWQTARPADVGPFQKREKKRKTLRSHRGISSGFCPQHRSLATVQFEASAKTTKPPHLDPGWTNGHETECTSWSTVPAPECTGIACPSMEQLPPGDLALPFRPCRDTPERGVGQNCKNQSRLSPKAT